MEDIIDKTSTIYEVPDTPQIPTDFELKVHFNPKKDQLTFSIPAFATSDPENIHIEERIPNHRWKINKELDRVFYCRISSASHEFGLVWLHGVFSSQLYSVAGGEQLLETILSEAAKESGLVIPSNQEVARFA